jgi:hypothetical protein
MLCQDQSRNKRGREDRDSVVAGAKASRNKARVVRGILTRQLCVYYTAKHEKGLHPTLAAELDRSRAPFVLKEILVVPATLPRKYNFEPKATVFWADRINDALLHCG